MYPRLWGRGVQLLEDQDTPKRQQGGTASAGNGEQGIVYQRRISWSAQSSSNDCQVARRSSFDGISSVSRLRARRGAVCLVLGRGQRDERGRAVQRWISKHEKHEGDKTWGVQGQEKTSMDGNTSLQIPEPSFMEIGSRVGLKVEFVALMVCVKKMSFEAIVREGRTQRALRSPLSVLCRCRVPATPGSRGSLVRPGWGILKEH